VRIAAFPLTLLILIGAAGPSFAAGSRDGSAIDRAVVAGQFTNATRYWATPGAVSNQCGTPSLTVKPGSGPQGTQVSVSGSGYCGTFLVVLFVDAADVRFQLGWPSFDAGAFSTEVAVPTDAASGPGRIVAKSGVWKCIPIMHGCRYVRAWLSHVRSSFTVT